jgi:TonB family protein
MPHKHNDIKHWVDPEQIRRYLAGELDDKAMHLLEKQALEDPFLAEALEGFAEHAPDQSIHLADLENRLEQRVAVKKERKLPVYYRWAAAAAILLLVGVGLNKMWQLPEKKEVAKAIVVRDSVTPAATMNENGQVIEPKPDLALSDIKQSAPAPAAVVLPSEEKEAAVQSDDAVPGYSKVVTPAEEATQQEAPSFAKARKAEKNIMMDSVADNYAAAVAPSVPVPVPEKDKQIVLRGRVSGVAVSRSAPAPRRMLKGIVTDERNTPLPAVTVMEGTHNGVVTDQDGKFAIQVDSTKDVQLSINYVGYESRKLDVDNKQNNLNIAMNEQNQSLDEVVVSGYGQKRKQKITHQVPVPAEGFERYQEDLAKHVKYPAAAGDIKGVVRVAFTVKANGQLSKFKVIRKLQPDCDTEAIRVIKEGPAWTPASNGKSERVEVEVPFTP